jgi:hypothetical protein
MVFVLRLIDKFLFCCVCSLCIYSLIFSWQFALITRNDMYSFGKFVYSKILVNKVVIVCWVVTGGKDELNMLRVRSN